MILTLAVFCLYFFILVGLIFNALAVFGLFRFPDAYTRLHAATKCTTFGMIFITLAVALYGFVLEFTNPGFQTLSIHSLVAMVFILLTNPMGAHAIARAAYRTDYKMFKKETKADAKTELVRDVTKKEAVHK
jgi:multicomponent Na+:H+ antiporter subunit G